MTFYDRFLETLKREYPETARSIDLTERVSPLLLCPTALELPQSILEQARAIARAFQALRDLPERKRELERLTPQVIDPGNASALMSFDFHIDDSGSLRLIEINTNASMALMSDLIYKTHQLENHISRDFKETIWRTFESEWRHVFADRTGSPESIAIVDEEPAHQRLYIEFLLYRELFHQHGALARIADPRDLRFENQTLSLEGTKVDLVYNRHTDFYFETPITRTLKDAFDAKAACVSPNPHEYRLLADKERLNELSRPGAIDRLPLSQVFKDTIRQTLIPTLEVSSFPDHDALWAERKKWFFKPKRSFGGKATYRGGSISRSTFAQVASGDFLAQEYVPASTTEIEVDGKKEEFKYDLRFFSYKDEVQLACARLYKGQMTNSQTPGGGVAAIKWV